MQDADASGDAQTGVAAALSQAACATNTPAAQDARRRLAGTPWAAAHAASSLTRVSHQYTFLPVAQAGRDVRVAFSVPPPARAAALGGAASSTAGAEGTADAWNQCIDRAEVCAILQELAKLASADAPAGGHACSHRMHAVNAMGHVIAQYLTSHSTVRPRPTATASSCRAPSGVVQSFVFSRAG